MPRLAEFFGIAIYMYFEDHPPPHFHAFYGDQEAVIDIESLRVLRGKVSPRAYGLIAEWGTLRRAELRRAWDQASLPGPIDPIEPLS
jgi:hypothetical protein